MSNVISVYSSVAQAKGFDVEVADSTLLATRYFPTTAGDEFAGKEVMFDFDGGDLEKGAFITSGYKNGNTTTWIANSVVPPRVGDSDVVDPTNQDRVLFERLCRAQGADLNRADAYQELLNIKAARLAKRTDRAIEVLAALVLAEGKIDFDQDKDESGSETDHIVCKFYDPSKGPDNHMTAKQAWSGASAKPYDDVCAMVNAMIAHGKRPEDLLLGATAWAVLARDEQFMKFAGATYHSEGMMLDFGEVEGAQHVARCVFNGVQLNVIVYSAGYKAADGSMKQFIDPNAAILISSNVGRTLCGGCTLLNPESIGYGIENAFVGLTGKHMQSIYKDFNNQKLHLREESRPLPAPKHSVNECDWIYMDTTIGNGSNDLGEVAKGISFGEASGWSCAATCVIAGKEVAITAGSGTLKAVHDGQPAETITVSSGKIVVPADCDRDADGKIILYVA